MRAVCEGEGALGAGTAIHVRDIVKLIFNWIYAGRERVTPLTAHTAPIR